jgi:glycosyltransferase involved in cell wall biosynthesis
LTLSVGFNLAYLVEDSGGSGTYARQLLPHLLLADPQVRLTAWIGTTAPEWLLREPWAAEVRWLRLPVPGIGTPWHLWHELVGIGLDAARKRLDVVHGLANLAPLVHPRVASVATILDVIWIHHPDATGPRFRAVMGTLVPLVARSSTRIIAISEAARDDIAATLGVDTDKFDVTPLGIERIAGVGPPDAARSLERSSAIRERLGLDARPVVLCVAAKRAHKNLHGLIAALALLARRPQSPPVQLVLPGSPNEYERELRAQAQELGVEASVHFPGWVSDPELAELYAGAACFVLPSFQEGFGLPVLEAMARGVPVACSDIPALTEVARDAAAYFDPHDPGSIAHTITRVTSDQRLARGLVERGYERCRRFTWERTAQATLASYARALG